MDSEKDEKMTDSLTPTEAYKLVKEKWQDRERETSLAEIIRIKAITIRFK